MILKMKLIPIEFNHSKSGVPNYYQISISWLKRYNDTGDAESLKKAHHYARVATEFNQAHIVEN
jgi:hypothetical protein